MKKIISILVLILCLCSCRSYETTSNTYDSDKEIQILYTFSSSKNEPAEKTYASIKQRKIDGLKITPNVTLIDTGNLSLGNSDKYNTNIDLMNDAGYDYAVFGLNDFSNGLEYFYQNTKHAKFKYLTCNVSYNGQTNDIFKNTYPYEVVDYDGIKVGYIGVFSPGYADIRPSYFMENGKTVINFYNETKEVFYDTVQCSINKVKELGADYVILISNMDVVSHNDIHEDYYLEDLVAGIYDADIIINGSEFSLFQELYLYDANDKKVLTVTGGSDSINTGKIIIKDSKIINSFFQ